MKKHILFIINPISGTGRQGSIPDEIEKYIDTSRYEYAIRMTEYAGHATLLAKEAIRKGYNTVVAVGGDGTINEVARAVVHTSTALGIIPCGSGNGLARHLQIPQNVRRAIEIINQDTIHCLDYGRINGHPFFCTCGMGFDAFVSMKFAEGKKRGPLQYVKDAISAGLRYKPETYTIENENGTERHEAFLITCANASQYGNNAYIAPEASMKDGLMDIIIIKPFKTIEGAQVAIQMFNKTLLNNSHVEMFKAEKVHITRPSEGVVHCDGDPILMGKAIDVVLIKKSFNIVVNPEAHSKKKNFLQDLADNFTLTLRPLLGQLREPTESEKDPFGLVRFVRAQEGIYDYAYNEIQQGYKHTHWMWYIFPQLRGLGHSSTANFYGISGRAEAEAYLAHEVLGPRLHDMARLLLTIQDKTATEIFGYPDNLKLKSCMTLFDAVSPADETFGKVLDKYFAGERCAYTLQQLEAEGPAEASAPSSTN